MRAISAWIRINLVEAVSLKVMHGTIYQPYQRRGSKFLSRSSVQTLKTSQNQTSTHAHEKH